MLTASRSRLDDTSTSSARRSRHVTASVVAHSAVRSGFVWGSVFGLYVTTQALAYTSGYKTSAARQLLVQQFGHNTGISAVVGPATSINTVAGFIEWKCLTVLVIMGAVWGIFASTKATRGEEDAGRWEVLLVGPVTRRGAAREAFTGLLLGGTTLFLTCALFLLALDHSSRVHIAAGRSLFFSLAIVSGPFMFLSVGALCAQLATSRRQAAGIASVILASCYALRMVADSGSGLAWLRWASPLGWVEELQPLTRPAPLALVPIALLIALTLAAALFIAGRRDLGAGTLPDRSNVARVHSLPTTSFGLGLALVRSTVIAWAIGIAAYGLLLGSIAKSGGEALTSSSAMRHVLLRLGVSGADAYLGVALLIMSLGLGFVAVGLIGAARREESSGQLDNLVVGPLRRATWLGERVGTGVVIIIALGLLAGVATWLGAASDHARVGVVSMLGAGLNVAVPALLLLGVGVLVVALAPRSTTTVTYSLFVWFVLVEIVGAVAHVNHWVLDLSAFHQMAPAPSTPIDWTTSAVMLALALATGSVGVFAFRRRDITGE